MCSGMQVYTSTSDVNLYLTGPHLWNSQQLILRSAGGDVRMGIRRSTGRQTQRQTAEFEVLALLTASSA